MLLPKWPDSGTVCSVWAWDFPLPLLSAGRELTGDVLETGIAKKTADDYQLCVLSCCLIRLKSCDSWTAAVALAIC